MLVKLLPNQIPVYQDVINEAIDKSMPHCEDRIKNNIYQELLLETSQCWIAYKGDDFEGVGITQIREESSVGAKTFTLLCMYAPNGTELQSFIDGWPTLQKFGKANGCKIFDFYSSNKEAIKYARYFDIVWETTYFQINIDKDRGYE